MKKLVTLVLMLSLLGTGCSTKKPMDLMVNIEKNRVSPVEDLTDESAAVADFGIRLFQKSMEFSKKENELISPLSVLCALSMTANGAKGHTLAQMEDVLGLDVDTLNHWIYSYMESLPEEETYKLSIANSIWFKDVESFTVNEDFLQLNADYYDASLYQVPFDDATLKAINNWVKEETHDMIPSILDKIPDEAVMYLVNALAFDAEWNDIYEENEIHDGTFTKEDGTTEKAEFMYATEGYYLEDDNATGFIKHYDDKKYAFVALLPKEGVTVEEYVNSLTGTDFMELFKTVENTSVKTAIPKFETEYDVEMSEILIAMGMTDAFDSAAADFTGIGTSLEGNIAISHVIHKTRISVDEKGTKAGAATLVEMVCESARSREENVKKVYLDRPFVYMVVDCETNLPFFMGTMMDVEA